MMLARSWVTVSIFVSLLNPATSAVAAECTAEAPAVKALGTFGGILVYETKGGTRQVVSVSLSLVSRDFQERDLTALRAFKSLKKLSLERLPCLTDKGMEIVGQLTTLEELNLRHTYITDRGVEKISKLAKLRVLDIGETDASGASTKVIAFCQQLEKLDLEGLSITAIDLRRLSALRRLRSLRLSRRSR